MHKVFKEIFETFSIKSALPYMVFLLGIIAYILGIGEILKFESVSDTTNNLINEILKAVGNLFVVGAIIGFMTSYTQFKRVYEKGLEEIMYSEKTLAKRNDIEEIWKKVSRILFASKFPEISDDLLSLINKEYFPKKRNSYYKDLIINIKLKWDEDKKYIIKKSTFSFILISDSDQEIRLPLGSWTYHKNTENTYNKISKFRYNKTVLDETMLKAYLTEELQENVMIQRHEIPVSGCSRYDIQYEKERKHVFDEDTDICYRANYIINDMKISLTYPDDLEAKLICRGTLKDYIDVGSSDGNLIYKYDGLILPRQGYVIILKRK